MRNKSVKNKLIFQILLILLPLLFCVNLIIYNMASALRKHTSLSSQYVVSLFMRQIDLSLADSYLLLITQRNNTVQLMKLNSKDETQRLYADITLFNSFRELLSLYPVIDTIFAYTPEYNDLVSASSADVTYDEKKMLRSYIEGLPASRDIVDDNWKLVPVNGHMYFLNIVTFNGGYLGIVTKPETLKSLVPSDSADLGSIVIADNHGEPLTDKELVQGLGLDLSKDLSTYYLSGDKELQLVIGKESSAADFRLLLVIPDMIVTKNISWVYIQSFILMIVSAAAFVGIIISIYREVLRPINKIVEAILQVESGNLSFGITPRDEAREYTSIYNAFNQMLKQIETLKIDNYEQQIKNQQSELHFYQMQIKPHFILSCLTTISNLADLGEMEKLTEFISDFSNFSRYLFHTEFSLISLRNEISQIEHYINLQKIRYPDKIFLLTDVPDNCYARQIPAMILQTLVENCIKHGMDSASGICIFIQCREVCSQLEVRSQSEVCSQPDADNNLILIVEDTGKGFSSEDLAEINGPSNDMNSGRFGLRNVKATLELNYGSKASINFENIEPKGTHVEIKLP